LDYKLKSGTDNELLVVFSPINIPKGKFGFSRYLETDSRYVLFFNCENTWYVDCISEMYDIVKSTIEELNPEGVVFYGASMGGYAAMRIGGSFPQFPSFIFGSEISLYMPGSLSQKHATIKTEGVNIIDQKKLDLSNTVALFGVYEPVDLVQYKLSLDLDFHSTIPVKSPHAVHEELYYRNLIRSLTNSRTCDEFVQNIPKNFYDQDTPIEHADFLYKLYFSNHFESVEDDISTLKEIEHPCSYWVLMRHAYYTKREQVFDFISSNLNTYFNEKSNGFSMPQKLSKQLRLVKSRIFQD